MPIFPQVVLNYADSIVNVSPCTENPVIIFTSDNTVHPYLAKSTLCLHDNMKKSHF